MHGDLGVQLPAGNVQSKVSIRPRQKSYTAQLTASGIRLDQLQALQAQKIDAKGVVSYPGKGSGNIRQPATRRHAADSADRHTESEDRGRQPADERSQSSGHCQPDLRGGGYANQGQREGQPNRRLRWRMPHSTRRRFPCSPSSPIYAPDQAADLTGQTEVHAPSTVRSRIRNCWKRTSPFQP